ncbi:hypothetical protein [Pseudomonas sp. NFX98]|uniref:hypothetical protein n=1 Tax=Pseudomonas sp. NFX98 TaxID=3399122 RepID=UPI0039FCE2C6
MVFWVARLWLVARRLAVLEQLVPGPQARVLLEQARPGLVQALVVVSVSGLASRWRQAVQVLRPWQAVLPRQPRRAS